MFNIKIDSQLDKMSEILKKVDSRDLKFVVRRAVNQTAERTLKKIQLEMPNYVDRPTPYAIRSLTVRGSRKSDAEVSAEIAWREYPGGKRFGVGRALEVQSEGGSRRPKGFEEALKSKGLMPSNAFAIPTEDAPKDAFGNVPGPFYVRVLSYLRALSEAGFKGNRAKGPRNNRQLKRESKLRIRAFAVWGGIVRGGSNQPTGLSDGIWERVPSAFGNGFRKLFFFVDKLSYTKRFPIKPIVERYVEKTLPFEVERAVDNAIKTRATFKD